MKPRNFGNLLIVLMGLCAVAHEAVEVVSAIRHDSCRLIGRGCEQPWNTPERDTHPHSD